MAEPLTETRPELENQHRVTAATLVQPDSPDLEPEPKKAGDQLDSPEPNPKKAGDPTRSDHKKDQSTRPRTHDVVLLFCISVMLIWPWIFFGVVWVKKGIQMDNRVAKVVENNPHATTYIITLICTIISMIVTSLFSLAIIRFAQELVTRHRSKRPQSTRPFHVRVMLALRHQNLPWGWKDRKYLLKKKRWLPAILVIICTLTFPHLVSTTTSLITPIPFNRTTSLSGNELDFTSSDPACMNYYQSNPIDSNCGWTLFDGQWYSTCLGESQMVDVLEAGRANILELLSNNSQALTFSQLGADNGLHFLGSMRGVIPLGPAGVPTLNNSLEPYPFSDPEISAAIISYSYTFDHQGLATDVNCSYQQTSPIVPGFVAPLTLQYNVSDCATLGQTDVLNYTDSYAPYLSVTNILMYWACQSTPNDTQAPSYSVYLSGPVNGYQNMTGSITCAVSMEPAIYSVTYESTTNIFSVGNVLPTNASGAYSPSVFSSILVSYPFTGLGGVISEAQNLDSNLVADSVVTFGVKSFGLTPYERDDTYLQLYEQMIQGILEYETSYIRLLDSLGQGPSSAACLRTLNGSLTYTVFGWFVTNANIGFLVPLTIVNGAALVALILALGHAKVVGYLHPNQPREVEYDPKFDEEEVPDEWKEKVAYNPTSILKDNFADVKDLAKGDAKEIGEGFATNAVEKEASRIV